MADLLVQNAVEAVKTAIASSGSGYDWNTILGRSLNAEVKAIIEGLATNGPYTTSSSTSRYLCDLSERCLMSWCQCAYFGSTTQCTASAPEADNVWNDGSVLAGGSGGKTQADIVTDSAKGILRGGAGDSQGLFTVSYTQLTLPTKRIV